VIVKKLALDCNGTSILVLVFCGLSLVELQGLFLALVFLFFCTLSGMGEILFDSFGQCCKETSQLELLSYQKEKEYQLYRNGEGIKVSG